MMSAPTYSLKQLCLYFLKLGTWGFGGPVALVGYMNRDLVERKKWITEADYKEGLALAQLAPGPLAAQLGIYMGYIHYGITGATLTGLAFVLPSFFMVLALGVIYEAYNGIPWMQAVFYGIGASVIGIIAYSAFKLTKKSISKGLWGIYGVAAVFTVWQESESVLIFLAAGILWWLIKRPPVLRAVVPVPLWEIFLYFTKAGAFVFGSGLAIVPFLYGGVVKEYGWLTEQEFIDAVAVAMITPGPVVITVGFIGYLTAGFQGASVAAFATFFPCYLFTVLPAPYFKKYGKHPGIKAFVDGVTAAAIGTITGAVIVLGKRSLVDGYTVAIALLTAFVCWKYSRVPEPLLILLAALVGIFLKVFIL
ncbi:chromate transporter [Chitinophaga niabensis]|uniref:chromate transporter n=1 Tax=Chitinophaga niabensis TaxID=536979 RepID=UPI0031BADAFC